MLCSVLCWINKKIYVQIVLIPISFRTSFVCDVISSASSIKQIACAMHCVVVGVFDNKRWTKGEMNSDKKTSWKCPKWRENLVNRKTVAFSHSPFSLAAAVAVAATVYVTPFCVCSPHTSNKLFIMRFFCLFKIKLELKLECCLWWNDYMNCSTKKLHLCSCGIK